MKKTMMTLSAIFFALKLAAEAISVGAVNCGQFHYARAGVAEGEYSAGWDALATNNETDVFFYSDVGKKVFPAGSRGVEGFDIRVVLKDGKGDISIVELPREIDVGGKIRKTPRYRALRVVRAHGGKKIAFYGVHLVAEGHIRTPKPPKGEMTFSQKLRRMQFKALMEDAKRFDLAVLAGDFNAQKPFEYDVFTEAGFVVANCSKEFGFHATLRNTLPADNIIVSGRLGILGFEVPQYYKINTDHYPVFARIDAEEAVAAAVAAVPSVEKYLTLPRSDREKLFADSLFRKKMFDRGYAPGTGLLSRWAAVEKIPNLRDVGGVKTKDGGELKRGVMYRSAGWNDNAKIKKGAPESEWKTGKTRLTKKGRVELKKLGIKTDLDLRSDGECWGMTGSPLGEDVKWVKIPFGAYARFKNHPRTREAVRKIFEVLADEKNYPLVFHCIGGADRTGCLAMMIQVLCGVEEDEALKDWELTGAYTARLNFIHSRTINHFLSYLAEFPGDTEEARMRNFLAACGVSEAQMEAVRRLMRESDTLDVNNDIGYN